MFRKGLDINRFIRKDGKPQFFIDFPFFKCVKRLVLKVFN